MGAIAWSSAALTSAAANDDSLTIVVTIPERAGGGTGPGGGDPGTVGGGSGSIGVGTNLPDGLAGTGGEPLSLLIPLALLAAGLAAVVWARLRARRTAG
ncbi:hypothetical protein ACIQLJ_11605 [Microbacterium sp. NPDC091313]